MEYRGIRYTINCEDGGDRTWVIYPADGPSKGARRGVAKSYGPGGEAPQSAVVAAQNAIDEWLGGTLK